MDTQNLCCTTTVLSRCCKYPHFNDIILHKATHAMTWMKNRGWHIQDEQQIQLLIIHREKKRENIKGLSFLLSARDVSDLLGFPWLLVVFGYITSRAACHKTREAAFFCPVCVFKIMHCINHYTILVRLRDSQSFQSSFLGNVAMDEALMWGSVEDWRHPWDLATNTRLMKCIERGSHVCSKISISAVGGNKQICVCVRDWSGRCSSPQFATQSNAG